MPAKRKRNTDLADDLVSSSHEEKVSYSRKEEKESLVHEVNSLPLSLFIDQYIPSYAVDFTARLSKPDSSDAINNTEQEAYSLQFYTASSIPDAYISACYDLVHLTSSEDYKRSSSGWSARKKKLEMRLLDMRYMVLVAGNDRMTESNAGPLVGGFLSFMVTEEDEVPVLYCYEIHLAPELQHQGIGRQLLQIFEDIGKNVGLQKGMLTVFKSNKGAIRFYEHIGFEEDEYSPKPVRLRNGRIRDFDYMIMSKHFVCEGAA